MKNILLVVDCQTGFVQSNSSVLAAKNINNLISTGFFDIVIATKYLNYIGSPIIELSGYNKMFSSEETKLCIDSNGINHIIEKSMYSAYNEELIKCLLDDNQGEMPNTVFICGLDMECCILATAIDFFERGIRPIVLAKYCGSSLGDAQYDAGLLSLNSLIGKNNIVFDEIISKEHLQNIVSNACIVENSDANTEETNVLVVKKLIEKGYHIAFAESCTGGRAAAKLVDVADASKVLCMSFVTYSNEAKSELLGVSEKTLLQYGAVSENTAREMALGVSKVANSEVGIGISGIAGPTGGVPGKPIGTVCFGFNINGKITTCTKHFGNIGRSAVRNASVNFVFSNLLDLL